MIRSWIARLIAVVTLTATVWCSDTPVLARTVPQHLSIVVNAEFTDIPDTATAGPTLVTLDNEIDVPFGVTLYFVPPSLVTQVLAATPAAGATEDGDLPAWLNQATPIGGPGIAGPDGSTEAVLDLVPGSYAFVFDVFDPTSGTLLRYLLAYDDGTPFFLVVEEATATVPAPTRTPTRKPTSTATTNVRATPTADDEATEAPLQTEPTIDGDPEEFPTEEVTLPDESATVVMTDDAFLLPSSFPVGPQTWEVVNQGQLPHALIVVAIPAGTTADQLRAALFPTPGESAQISFDTSAMINVGGLGPLAPGLSAAATLDLPAGTYAVFSALPDPTTGEPDGAQGLLAIFVIG